MWVASAAARILTAVRVGVAGLLMRNTCALKMHVYMPKRWSRRRAERTAAAYRKISVGGKCKFQRWSWIGAACTLHRLRLYCASRRLVPCIASACTPHRPWGQDAKNGQRQRELLGAAASHSIFRLGNPDNRGQAALRWRTPMRANFSSTCARRRHHAVGLVRAREVPANRRGKTRRDFVLSRNVACSRRTWSAGR